ncbi:MAG: DUF3472 domain-containing protein [Chitinophagaceae bacterium]|nr:MAG: DUF3472 domain-containing protein [Chitinophagaceae bacterium]
MHSTKTLKTTGISIILGSCLFMLSFIKVSSYKEIVAEINTIKVPLAGNTFSSLKIENNITDSGIRNWTDIHQTFTTYVRVSKTGNVKVWLHANVPGGKSNIELSIGNHSRRIDLTGAAVKNYYAGEWTIRDTGYIAFQIKGISKTGTAFAAIDSLELAGTPFSGKTSFVPDNEGNFYYWGRRGPSVHLNYPVPEHENIAWFYTEITVPEGNDVLGSYFEADGFGQGYFGMQVNSPDTRHILFSVWSPYDTQNPNDIPDSLKIKLIKKGGGVHAGEFGNEGSGGQSYLNYIWKAGNTYKFLLHCQQQDDDHTVFTAYFYAPEKRKWLLIASFSRPRTHAYLNGLYSFLENFDPQQGAVKRMAYYGNQWICTDKGQWVELNKALFTTDNTGNKGYRMDYAGGVKEGRFYLQNCGFFNHYTLNRTVLVRQSTGVKPDIDFTDLP